MTSDCIFGFGKHEPDCSFLKPENPNEFKFTVLRLGYTCSKCENKLNKIYDKQIKHSVGWNSSFDAFKGICIGEQLKQLIGDNALTQVSDLILSKNKPLTATTS
jgi:hypothetical protein